MLDDLITLAVAVLIAMILLRYTKFGRQDNSNPDE